MPYVSGQAQLAAEAVDGVRAVDGVKAVDGVRSTLGLQLTSRNILVRQEIRRNVKI